MRNSEFSDVQMNWVNAALELRGQITRAWERKAIPQLDAADLDFDGPGMLDVSTAVVGRRFDQLDFNDQRLVGEYLLVRIHGEPVAYYMGAHLLHATDPVRAKSAEFRLLEDPEIDLFTVLFTPQQLSSVLVHCDDEQRATLKAFIRFVLTYADFYGLDVIELPAGVIGGAVAALRELERMPRH